jgi:hypothetical protein
MCLALKCAELARKQAAQPVYVGPNPDPFTVLVADTDDEFVKILRQYLKGGYESSFGDAMLRQLLISHEQAHVLGQSKWGGVNVGRAEAEANKVVRLGKAVVNPRTYDVTMVQPEANFVAGFIRDLIDKDKRYFEPDGSPRVEQILGRMRMYEGKLRGTEGWGVLDGGPFLQLWEWQLGGTEDHCEDCPYLASLVPVTRDEWFATPGECMTPCLWNCLCKLVAVGAEISTADPIRRAA